MLIKKKKFIITYKYKYNSLCIKKSAWPLSSSSQNSKLNLISAPALVTAWVHIGVGGDLSSCILFLFAAMYSIHSLPICTWIWFYSIFLVHSLLAKGDAPANLCFLWLLGKNVIMATRRVTSLVHHLGVSVWSLFTSRAAMVHLIFCVGVA